LSTTGSPTRQGNQIGQIFANWEIVHFGQCFEKYRSSANFWLLFSTVLVTDKFWQKNDRATFLATLHKLVRSPCCQRTKAAVLSTHGLVYKKIFVHWFLLCCFLTEDSINFYALTCVYFNQLTLFVTENVIHFNIQLQRAVIKSSSSWELASCKLDRDKFTYFKFGVWKVLNLNSI
jgi:hypothetical protein